MPGSRVVVNGCVCSCRIGRSRLRSLDRFVNYRRGTVRKSQMERAVDCERVVAAVVIESKATKYIVMHSKNVSGRCPLVLDGTRELSRSVGDDAYTDDDKHCPH
jgi:hypothetical protein